MNWISNPNNPTSTKICRRNGRDPEFAWVSSPNLSFTSGNSWAKERSYYVRFILRLSTSVKRNILKKKMKCSVIADSTKVKRPTNTNQNLHTCFNRMEILGTGLLLWLFISSTKSKPSPGTNPLLFNLKTKPTGPSLQHKHPKCFCLVNWDGNSAPAAVFKSTIPLTVKMAVVVLSNPQDFFRVLEILYCICPYLPLNEEGIPRGNWNENGNSCRPGESWISGPPVNCKNLINFKYHKICHSDFLIRRGYSDSPPRGMRKDARET